MAQSYEFQFSKYERRPSQSLSSRADDKRHFDDMYLRAIGFWAGMLTARLAAIKQRKRVSREAWEMRGDASTLSYGLGCKN